MSGGVLPPTDRRWMLFVDGENLTIRAENLAGASGISIGEGRHYKQGVFVWIPDQDPRRLLASNAALGLREFATRAYYYTSVVGDELALLAVREQLRALRFDPQVFKKDRGQQKSKGVDVTLTKDVLSHAFMGNYDAAVLVAGDGDYVPLVQELKRLGKVVSVAFFSENNGLNTSLRLEADHFLDLNNAFLTPWRGGNS